MALGRGSCDLALLPPGPGPMSDAETMWLTASGDVVELWSTDARGLEIRRHPPNGQMKVLSLAPLPRRTPHDHPLFNVAGVMERASGDLFLTGASTSSSFRWPARPAASTCAPPSSARPIFRPLPRPLPEGIWVGIESGKNLDLTFLPEADLEARMTPAP